MVKFASELVPGDVISLGLGGPQMIVAAKPISGGIAIICDCGERQLLPYDCKMYVYYNADEQREIRRNQLLAECKQIAMIYEQRARKDKQGRAEYLKQKELEHGLP